MTDPAISLYLDLLKRCVINLIYEDPAIRYPWDDSSDRVLLPFDRDKRLSWPRSTTPHSCTVPRRLHDHVRRTITVAGGSGAASACINFSYCDKNTGGVTVTWHARRHNL